MNIINILHEKHKDDLQYYKYIETIEEFSILSLQGKIKYINKYDGKLRYGGLVIKIYKNQTNNNWVCVLKQISGKTYNVSFKNNHIFYSDNKDNKIIDWMKCFISDVHNNKYIVI